MTPNAPRREVFFGVHPRHVSVHVPFCARRCVYCDFAIAVRRSAPVVEYVSAIGRELSVRFPADGAWLVDTVYLGGGTPSRLCRAGVAPIVAGLRPGLSLHAGAEG